VELRRLYPGLPVVVLSQYVEHTYAAELVETGAAVGYLLKDRVGDVAEFLNALDQVASGGTVIDPEVVRKLLSRRRIQAPLERLTARERDVLAQMAEGRSNSAIARQLAVSDAAIAKHVNNIFAKLDLPPATDNHRRVLAVLAYLRG
jgi:DNA-binding NarL/FixJ family response regulator